MRKITMTGTLSVGQGTSDEPPPAGQALPPPPPPPPRPRRYEVSTLTDELLDRAVAQVIGWNGTTCPKFSSEWRLGGPIIDHERIATYYEREAHLPCWVAGFELTVEDGYVSDVTAGGPPSISLEHSACGVTPLEAAMRAYVLFKLGREVTLP